MKVTIAAAQIPQSNDPAENLSRILTVMDNVSADIICFPETALTGECKESLDDFHLAIANKAKERGIWCIYGAYVRRGRNVHNEAFVVNRSGQVISSYQKKHLWSVEEGVTAGNRINTPVSTEFGLIGLIICWDIAFPEEVRRLAQQGARIVFCPAYWYGRQYRTTQMIEMLPRVRAFENQIYFVLCDAYTAETAARSRICSPLKVLAEARVAEEIITATVDMAELEKFRKIFDCWKRPASRHDPL
jgi:predicted amidohydrolase